MSNSPPKQIEHTFYIRIWYEGAASGSRQWRGSIAHLPSNRQMYFLTPADLLDFITLNLQEKQETETPLNS